MPDHITPQDVPTKTCTKCGKTLPATAEFFTRNKKTRDGLHAHCKECRSAYSTANRERFAEYKRIYGAAYYAANRERCRAYDAANRERRRENKRAWTAANRERLTEYKRFYRATHPGFVSASNRRRRARRLSAEGTHTAADIEAQVKRQKGKCFWCGEKVGDTYHVDHIVPLSRGGSNDPENLVIACPSCNCSKQDKLPSEWPQGNRLL